MKYKLKYCKILFNEFCGLEQFAKKYMYFHPQKFNQIENRTNSFINSLEKLLQNNFLDRSFGKPIIKQSINHFINPSIDYPYQMIG